MALTIEQEAQQPTGTAGVNGKHADELIDLIAMVRDSGAWIGPNSEQFLDGLLGRAHAYASIFISPKQQRSLDDLVRKAKEATQ